jgi:adenylate cyclase
MNLDAYLAQDRRHTLARQELLPDRTTGSVLFADISGFTTLTESLRHRFGPRRGAEELTKHLDAVFAALIAEVERYGGSVIGFAGDAITCWFDEMNKGRGMRDEKQAAQRAVACGLSLQAAMRTFATITLPEMEPVLLALKVAVASGVARRFVVGDSRYGYLDTLAGATINRTAVAEQLANRDELIIDAATARLLGEALTLHQWRTDPHTGMSFAVVSGLTGDILPSQEAPSALLDPEQVRPWLHPTLYERQQVGKISFLAEFRPCVALFIRFTGIDYDGDDAGRQLDIFIQQTQQLAAQYDGALLHLIIGDKGSYLYLNFGALSVHEDEAQRAAKTALALRQMAQTHPWLDPLQIGLAQGVMWTGSYGAATRRTYSAFGADVNLAARLMQTAAAGEILVSDRLQQQLAHSFTIGPEQKVTLKGNSKPAFVFTLRDQPQSRFVRLQEPHYALPMIGRTAELRLITEKLHLGQSGHGQLIGLVAEAGLGKSRLVAEAIRSAQEAGFISYGGACQSYALNTPYHPWKSIWQAFFGLDPDDPLPAKVGQLKEVVRTYAPSRRQALPLLSVLLNIHIPDNDFTRTLEPKTRQSALHALLEDCLKAAAQKRPLLLIVEDSHWLDALSHDLLVQLAQALSHFPVCFLLAYRPPKGTSPAASRLESLPHFTKIQLHELDEIEGTQLIEAKLAQLYPSRSEPLPIALVETLMARSQGNPFYLEELLNYLRDRGLDPDALPQIELPDSLHTLILSRIDQLHEQEKNILRVASVIGRLFPAAWLTGYYPELGDFPQVKASLEQLHNLDITPLDSPEPELAYLFKHIVTHEVAYENLPFATRAQLHERLARYLEKAYAASPPLEALAFHYGRSDNTTKKRDYFRKAGDAARQTFANQAALDYFSRLYPLLDNLPEQIELLLDQGAVEELIGEYTNAETSYRSALALAEDCADRLAIARCQLELGELLRMRGEYAAAEDYLQQARTGFALLDHKANLAHTCLTMGIVMVLQGQRDDGQQEMEDGLKLAQEAGETKIAAMALNSLGNVAIMRSDYEAAQSLYEQSLAIGQAMGDKRQIAHARNNLGILAYRRHDYAAAQAFYQQSLTLCLEMGDKAGMANAFVNLGNLAFAQGKYPAAQLAHEQSLALCQEMGNKAGITAALGNLGRVAQEQGDYATAQTLYEERLVLSREIKNKRGIATGLLNLGNLAYKQKNSRAAQAAYTEGLRLGQEMNDKAYLAYNLSGLAGVATLLSDFPRAARLAAVVTNLRLNITSITWLRIEEAIYQEVASAVRAQLDEAAFQAAWADGTAMSLEEAVAYALDEMALPAPFYY